MTGYLELLKTFNLNLTLNSIVDWMPNRANYDFPINVVATSRYIWEQGGPTLRSGSIVFYTDG